jgi:hypothetical protein
MILLLAGLIFVTLGNSVGMAQQSSGGPPQETIAACYLQEWSLRFYSKMPFHSFYDFVFFHLENICKSKNTQPYYEVLRFFAKIGGPVVG